MRVEKFRTEVVGAVFTLARYPLAEYVASRVRNDKPILAGMAATVLADIYDGELSRRFNPEVNYDTPLRRIIDGTVDHATVGRVAFEIAKKNPAARPYIAIIAARAAFAALGLNGTHLVTTGEVTRGRKKQKATHLSTALFGLAASTGNKPLTHITGALAATVAWGTAPAHLRSLGVATGGDYHDL